MRTTIPRSLLAACAILAATTGCIFPSDPGEFDFDFCEARITRVAFDPAAVTLRVGDTASVMANPIDAAGAGQFLCPVDWTSSNESVVRVVDLTSGFGKGLLGVGPGTAWVRGTSKGRTDSLLVTMSTTPIATVTLEAPTNALLVGQTMRAVATARDAAGNVLPVRRVQWRTTSSVLGVTTRGLVVARATGTASVQATMEGVTSSASVTTSRSAPAIQFLDASAGANHSCALVSGGGKAAGSAYCWGQGLTGQLGTGDLESHEFPTPVAGTTRFSRIAAGADHTCAETSDGAVYCWGANGIGQVGDGTNATRLVPTRVATTLALHGVVSGGGFSCALGTDGVPSCWGAWGRLTSLTPRRATTPTAFVSLAAAGPAVCGLTAEGAAYCWGQVEGRNVDAPTLVPGDVVFRELVVGGYAYCGLAVDAQVYCWGQPVGTIWDPATGNRTSPVALAQSAGSVALTMTSAGVCVTKSAGDLWCLGYFESQLGSGYQLAKVERGSDHAFARMEGGGQQACAIDVVGGGWCWGSNLERQVGVGEEIWTGRPLQLRIP
jgi:Regulator of chromosome condensation (RCC1) repeat